MTTWAIGDIQGCARSFDALLEAISFDPASDRLWLAGDLVNRGPDSLWVLRRAMALGGRVTAVLGNHDLHLLAIAAGVSPPREGDTFEGILAAPDRDELIDWLRRRPLLHHDAAIRTVLVHAGLPPAWSLAEARTHAAEVAEALAGPAWRQALRTLYGNEPSIWSPRLSPRDRRRYTINALTRMRYVDARGRLDFEHNGPPGTQPPELRPWYELCDPGEPAGGQVDDGNIQGNEVRTGEVQIGHAQAGGVHVVFGHWASLGLVSLRRRNPGREPNAESIAESFIENAAASARGLRARPGEVRFTCIDTGCVWGRSLTALPVDPPGDPVSVGSVEEGPP